MSIARREVCINHPNGKGAATHICKRGLNARWPNVKDPVCLMCSRLYSAAGCEIIPLTRDLALEDRPRARHDLTEEAC